ncbi:AraC family transcriptional regulator [Hydrogenophaga intermedia]|uniref:AraC family transcriptional regulator n=1 Tax=Hydrogenophaga intermedia TaxID=65786 RepID=UPI0020430A71|nr:AraC family transcriptional regulator [Hydrogenophaga intermedia]
MAHWLRRSGLGASSLDESSVQMSLSAFRRLISDAMLVTREPALGLLVGQRLTANAHGSLGLAAMSSGSVRQLIGVLERYVGTRVPIIAAYQDTLDTQLRFQFKETVPLGEVRHAVLEAVLLATKGIIDFVAIGTCRVDSVTLDFAPPGYAPFARSLFNCEVRYGMPWVGFLLPLDRVDQTLNTADSAAFQAAEALCQRDFDKFDSGHPVSARVRRLLIEHQHGFPSLSATARLLHVTPRTLHRRLVAEGTTYQQILEQVRHLLAVEYLRTRQLTVQEIAHALGYSDVANFRRAFRRWEGVPPTRILGRDLPA